VEVSIFYRHFEIFFLSYLRLYISDLVHDMILEHLITTSLFSDQKTSLDTLNNYPANSKQAICAAIIDAILSHPGQTLATWAHITFAMEAIGASFTISDLAHSSIIRSGIKIYASWLRSTPAPAKPHEETFICTIMEVSGTGGWDSIGVHQVFHTDPKPNYFSF